MLANKILSQIPRTGLRSIIRQAHDLGGVPGRVSTTK